MKEGERGVPCALCTCSSLLYPLTQPFSHHHHTTATALVLAVVSPTFQYYGDAAGNKASLHVESVSPMSAPPGAPIHVKTPVVNKPPSDKPVFVMFGRSTTVMGIYDASVQTPLMQKQGVPGEVRRSGEHRQ